MIEKFTCILCPNGCSLEAEVEDGKVLEVSGATCGKGKDYAIQEITDPRRNIASSVLVEGGTLPLASVRLDQAIPKGQIFPVMEEIKKVKVKAPVRIGQVIIENVLGLGSNVVITKNVGRADAEGR